MNGSANGSVCVSLDGAVGGSVDGFELGGGPWMGPCVDPWMNR